MLNLKEMEKNTLKQIKGLQFGFAHYEKQCTLNVFHAHWMEGGSAFEQYKTKADNGDYDAQLTLAFIYRTGLNLKKGANLKASKKRSDFMLS